LDEIRNAFGGYTLNDLPITGSWINPKTKENMEDSHTSIWITAENKLETINKLKQLKADWKARFEQEDIMMYYITIDTL
jgi:regulator of sigma D